MSNALATTDTTRREHIHFVRRIIFSNPSSPSGPYIILELGDGNRATGTALPEQFDQPGQYRFFGRWENDPKYGPQFRFSTFCFHRAAGRSAILKYLTDTCPGVGPKTAARLYDAYGESTVDRLRDEPMIVIAETGLNPELVDGASNAIRFDAAGGATKVELFGLFDRRGFPGKVIDACLKKWGVKAPDRIRRNPFNLLGMPGGGFKRCDKLWADLGLPANAMKRQVMSLAHLAKTDPIGHTWIAATELAQRLCDSIPGATPVPAIKVALRARKLMKHRDAAGQLFLAVYSRGAAEDRIIANIRRLTEDSQNLWPTDRIPVSQADGDRLPSEHQVERLRRATAAPVGVLCGGPGTGKSHCLAYLLKEVIAEHGYESIGVCAPTGKASVRIKQALTAAGKSLGIDELGAIQPTTIHRLLGITRNGHDGDGWGFDHGPKKPLSQRFFAMDETSMADADLLADFLDAIPAGGHVLFIGDPYQLPPVGHGAPLRDMIASGLPVGELTQVRRNAGQIVHACARIKSGEQFETAETIDLDAVPPKNLRIFPTSDSKKQAELLEALLGKLTRFDPVWQTQVIVARNKGSDIARRELNDRLQGLLNPNGIAARGNPFRVGDKVICLRNSSLVVVEPEPGMRYRDVDREACLADPSRYTIVMEWNKFLDKEAPKELYVANGEIGRVIAVSETTTIVRFSESHEIVRIPMAKPKPGGVADDDEDGGDSGGEKGRGCNFDLAYACTCHKLQGSESPCVIVMGDESGGRVTGREWLYTAISRASELCLMIGNAGVFGNMARRVALERRRTFLSEKLRAISNTITKGGE